MLPGSRPAASLVSQQPSKTRPTTNLRVDDDAHGLLLVSTFVDINGTKAIRMAHDRDACRFLDVAHKRIAPARDNEIDMPVEREKGRDLSARLHGLHKCEWKLRSAKCGLNHFRKLGRRAGRLLAAFQNCSVALSAY
jgi:hypothetical protein